MFVQIVCRDLLWLDVVREASLCLGVTLEAVEDGEERHWILEDVGSLLLLNVSQFLLDLSLEELRLGVIPLISFEFRTLSIERLHEVLVCHLQPSLDSVNIPNGPQSRTLV